VDDVAGYLKKAEVLGVCWLSLKWRSDVFR
jgi:hypothetical protein